MLRFILLFASLAALSSPALAGVEGRTWSAVKELYRSPEAENLKGSDPTTQNERDRRGFPFPGGDWSSRVAWEARFALSQRADGTSAWPVPGGFLGDWNYVASDWYAYGRAYAEAGGVVGRVGDDASGHHCGGWCTFFVRLVLYRSTHWAGYGSHLTTPGFPGSVYSWCDAAHMTQEYYRAAPGWVISSPNVHMGFLERRAQVNNQWGWWVIDSNWVGGNGNYWIGKHFMSDTALRNGGYWAWAPTWATTN